MAESMEVIKGLVAGREIDYQGTHAADPLDHPGVGLPMWVAGYGPRTLDMIGRRADGYRAAARRPADPRVDRWRGARRSSGSGSGPRQHHDRRRGTGVRRRRRRASARTGALVRRDGGKPRGRSGASIRAHSSRSERLTEYIKYRESYDYSHHGKAGNPTTELRSRRDRRPVLHSRHRRRSPQEARRAA